MANMHPTKLVFEVKRNTNVLISRLFDLFRRGQRYFFPTDKTVAKSSFGRCFVSIR